MTKEFSCVAFLVHNKVDNAYTKDELKDELLYLNQILLSKGQAIVQRNRYQFRVWSKGAYTQCVIDARLKLIEIYPQFISSRQQEIRSTFET